MIILTLGKIIKLISLKIIFKISIRKNNTIINF